MVLPMLLAYLSLFLTMHENVAESACTNLDLSTSTGTYTYDTAVCLNIYGTLSKATTFTSKSTLTINLGNINIHLPSFAVVGKYAMIFQSYGGQVQLNGNGNTLDAGAYIDTSHRPGMIQVYAQYGGYFKSYNINNAPAWNVALVVKQFSVSDIIIKARNYGNTDGFDIASSSDLNFQRIQVYNNDDCIAINEGVSRVTIDTITCSSTSNGGGIALATTGKSSNGISSIVITNAKMYSHSPGALSIRTVVGDAASITGPITLSGTVYSGDHVLLITQQVEPPNYYICDPQMYAVNVPLSNVCPSGHAPAKVQTAKISGVIDLTGVVKGYTSHTSYLSYVEQYDNPSYSNPTMKLASWLQSSYIRCSTPDKCKGTWSLAIEDSNASSPTSDMSLGLVVTLSVIGVIVIVAIVFFGILIHMKKNRQTELV